MRVELLNCPECGQRAYPHEGDRRSGRWSNTILYECSNHECDHMWEEDLNLPSRKAEAKYRRSSRPELIYQ